MLKSIEALRGHTGNVITVKHSISQASKFGELTGEACLRIFILAHKFIL